MAMALHTRWMGTQPEVIHATGGASANRDVLQVMADVFGATILELPGRNSAALGAALRAYHADATASRRPVDWADIVRGFTDPVPGARIEPVAANVEVYRRHMEEYLRVEREALPRGLS